MPAERRQRGELLAELDAHVARAVLARTALGDGELDQAGGLVALDRSEIDHELAVRRLAHIVGELGETHRGDLGEHRLPALRDQAGRRPVAGAVVGGGRGLSRLAPQLGNTRLDLRNLEKLVGVGAQRLGVLEAGSAVRRRGIARRRTLHVELAEFFPAVTLQRLAGHGRLQLLITVRARGHARPPPSTRKGRATRGLASVCKFSMLRRPGENPALRRDRLLAQSSAARQEKSRQLHGCEQACEWRSKLAKTHEDETVPERAIRGNANASLSATRSATDRTREVSCFFRQQQPSSTGSESPPSP
jgi:hypothetical protein